MEVIGDSEVASTSMAGPCRQLHVAVRRNGNQRATISRGAVADTPRRQRKGCVADMKSRADSPHSACGRDARGLRKA